MPEVDRDAIRTHKGIIAEPNCSTTIMVTALAPIHRAARIRRIVVSTYQSVSGAGAKPWPNWRHRCGRTPKASRNGPGAARGLRRQHYPIALTLIPQIDVFEELGYTKEEWKMVYETRKILDEPGLAVSPPRPGAGDAAQPLGVDQHRDPEPISPELGAVETT